MEDNAPIIGITGATGNIGRMVASLLSDTGGLRLFVRTPAKLDPELADVAQVRATQYADDPSTVEALEGVDVLFMVSATESPDRVEVHRAFVDAAKKAGVEHIVYTSFLEASPDAVFTYARDHWHTEEHIKASGMDWTFLRDSLYLEFFAELGDSGEIRGPAAGGRCAAIARTDVARSAAAVLADPAAHASQTYNLTGPEALTMNDFARVYEEETGRKVRYVDETVEEAYESRASYGAPEWEVDAWVSTYTAIAAGELDIVSDSVEFLTGRKPVDFHDLLVGRR